MIAIFTEAIGNAVGEDRFASLICMPSQRHLCQALDIILTGAALQCSLLARRLHWSGASLIRGAVQPPCKEGTGPWSSAILARMLHCSAAPCKDDAPGILQVTLGHIMVGDSESFNDRVGDTSAGEELMLAMGFILSVCFRKEEFASWTIRLEDSNIYRMPPREEASYICYPIERMPPREEASYYILSRMHPL